MSNSKKFKVYTEEDLNTIIFELKNQKVGIIRTDTIIGIIALDPEVIYKAKKRPNSKKIIKFVKKDFSGLSNLNTLQKEFLNLFWPGQVSIIYNDESYRCPNVCLINKLLDYLEVIYCSSANISGQQTINDIYDANYEFDHINYYNIFLVDNDVKSITKEESTIVNINRWEIIRHGAKKYEVNEWINQKIKK